MHGPGQPGRHPRPTAGEVLRRALALSSVAARAGLEGRAGEADAQAQHARLLAWSRATGIAEVLEADESTVVETPLGQLSDSAVTNASWQAEGVYVLAWALDRCGQLPHDRLVDPNEVAWPLGFLDGDAHRAATAFELRGERAIDTFLACQLAVHWRLREYALRPGPMDFAAVVSSGGWARLDIDAAALVEGDLAIDGRPIDRADAATIERCTSIASERHRAANWLAGADPVYSRVENIT